MDKIQFKASIKRIIYKSTLITAIFLSMGACSGIGVGPSMYLSIIAALFYSFIPEIDLFPMLLNFLISSFLINKLGISGTMISILLCALMLPLFKKSTHITEWAKEPIVRGSASLACALTITVLITDYYFGIGATGSTVIDMIKSYHSLGFHPNWRGILYGTVVMVIMITFPRKFKKISKVISYSFAALIITWLLNFWLIPQSSVSVISMLEKADFSLYPISGFKYLLHIKTILLIIVSAASMALTFFFTEKSENESRVNNIGNTAGIILSSGFGLPITAKAQQFGKINFSEGIISAALIAVSFIATNGFERMPVSSCAVVLIVAAWQSLDKKAIAATIKAPIFCAFLIILQIGFLISFPAIGVIASFVTVPIIKLIEKIN